MLGASNWKPESKFVINVVENLCTTVCVERTWIYLEFLNKRALKIFRLPLVYFLDLIEKVQKRITKHIF